MCSACPHRGLDFCVARSLGPRHREWSGLTILPISRSAAPKASHAQPVCVTGDVTRVATVQMDGARALAAADLQPAAIHRPRPLCKSYCGSNHKVCRRLDCMACAFCNSTDDRVAHEVARIAEFDAVDCMADGSFKIGATRWPAAFHFLDAGVAQFLLETVASASLLDVGAGSGQYGAWFEAQRQKRASAAGVPMWRGVDGAVDIEQFTRERGPPGAAVSHANVCDAQLRLPHADWVMSLEVGEHVPASCVAAYCELLSRSARMGLVLSWAHHGQGGRCHISTRDAQWVHSTFGKLGWTVDWPLTARARNASHLAWLRTNIVAFRRTPPANSTKAWAWPWAWPWSVAVSTRPRDS